MRFQPLAFAVLSLLAACGESGSGDGDGGEPGSGGSGAATSGGSGGASSGGAPTGGSSGASTGGSQSGGGGSGAEGGTNEGGSTATGGSAGSATGGDAGSATGGSSTGGSSTGGDGGSGGSGGAPVTPDETVVITIPDLPGCDAPYPHDPAVDPATGVVYYADSNVSCIGEYDPETMEFRAWPTPTADSYPHGLVVDDESRVFWTGQDQDRIGRLVPSGMGMVEDFTTMANGPHTPTFHQGDIWFTAQQGGQYGRFDRETGMSEVWPFENTSSRPYGMWPAPDGTLWVALFGTNRLARITTGATPSVEEFVLPNTQSRPRRLAVDANGRVWYTDYPRRVLGMMDPEAPEASRFDEFDMPGGGQPYGIATGPDGNVWMSDEDVPEIVGFDVNERTVIAQLEVPIANAGPVRNMSVDIARKRIWLAISNVGHLGLLQF
jgi:virginiamycin B lyase